jgi:hypothetical protein
MHLSVREVIMADNEMRESPAGMSMFGTFQSCMRKGAFQYLLGFRRNGDKTVPLAHGSAVHEGFKEFYLTWDINKAVNRAIEVAQEDIDVFESMKIEARRLTELFNEWYKVYGSTEKEKYMVISNETQGEIQLPNGAVLTVRLDQVLREIKTGHIYIQDTKTTGYSLEGTITDYEYKAQPLLYIAYVYQTNPEWLADFRGWITNAIYQRVNYRKDGALSSISTKCLRSTPILYTEAECQSFLESLTTTTSEIAWAYSSFKKGAPFNACFPMNRGSCRNWNRTCPFWSICFQTFEPDASPPPPYELDPWKEEGVIEDVLSKISV